MSPETSHLVVLGILNIPVYLFVGKLMFDGWGDFFDCVKLWATPEILLLFRGQLMDEWWAALRLSLLVLVCGAIVYGEYHILFEKADQARAAIVQPVAPH